MVWNRRSSRAFSLGSREHSCSRRQQGWVGMRGSLGFSAATRALSILGIGALVHQWRWGRVTFAGAISGLCFFLLIQPEADRQGEGLWFAAAIALLCLGVGGTCYRVFKNERIHVGIAPLLWVVVGLTMDLRDYGWTYTTTGHLGGMIAGALLIRPALHRKSPTLATTWTKDALCSVCLRLWGPVQRPIPRGWLHWDGDSGSTGDCYSSCVACCRLPQKSAGPTDRELSQSLSQVACIAWEPRTEMGMPGYATVTGPHPVATNPTPLRPQRPPIQHHLRGGRIVTWCRILTVSATDFAHVTDECMTSSARSMVVAIGDLAATTRRRARAPRPPRRCHRIPVRPSGSGAPA